MKFKILLILMCSIFALQGCATTDQTIKIVSVPSPEQEIINNDGKQIITSQKKHLVYLSPISEPNVAKDKTMFMLSVQNCGEESINITYDNLSVIFEENTKKRALNKINVQSPDDFIKDLRNELENIDLKWYISTCDDILYKFNSAIAASPGQSKDLSAKFRAEMDALNNELNKVRTQRRQFIEEVQQVVMKPQTIMPGQSGGGLVVCDTRNMNKDVEGNFQVIVSADCEEYKFTFNRSLYK